MGNSKKFSPLTYLVFYFQYIKKVIPDVDSPNWLGIMSQQTPYEAFVNLNDKIKKKRGVPEELRTTRSNPLYQKLYRCKDWSHMSDIVRDGKGLQRIMELIYGDTGVDKLREYLEKIEGDVERMLRDREKIRDEKEVAQDLVNSFWYFFYHEYVESRSPLTYVSRFVLHFENNNRAVLHDLDDVPFEGIYDFSDNKFIVLNLMKGSKALQIRLSAPEIQDEAMLIGQYIDYEGGKSIINGTCIIQKITKRALTKNEIIERDDIGFKYFELSDNVKVALATIPLHHKTHWKLFIPEPVGRYLADKWMNHTKTSDKVTNLSTLEMFLRNKEKPGVVSIKHNYPIQWDLFVITPVGSLSSIESRELRKEIEDDWFKCEGDLKELGVENYYYGPVLEGLKEQPLEIIDRELYNLKRSNVVLVYLPKIVVSSAFIRLGWAMMLNKPIFIFYKGKLKELPAPIQKDINSKKVYVQQIKGRQGIFQMLCNNYGKTINNLCNPFANG